MRKDNDDFGSPEPWCARAWTTPNATGWYPILSHLKKRVTGPVLGPTIEYWHNLDKTIGDRIAQGVIGG